MPVDRHDSLAGKLLHIQMQDSPPPVGASLLAIRGLRWCLFFGTIRLQASSYKFKCKMRLPCRSQPAGDSWPEVVPVFWHDSLAGKLLQNQMQDAPPPVGASLLAIRGLR